MCMCVCAFVCVYAAKLEESANIDMLLDSARI